MNWYIDKMVIAHKERDFDSRRDYAAMAGVDFVKWFYL